MASTPDTSARAAQAIQLMHTAHIPLFALVAYSRAPERVPIATLLSAAEAAQRGMDELRAATRILTPLAKEVIAHPPAEPTDLAELAVLESLRPDFAELCELLGRALDVAERIDRARGRSYPEKIGGSCGWDLAEEVNQLLAHVELESGRTRGKGLE